MIRQSKLPFFTVSQSPAKRQRLGSTCLSKAAASLAALQRQPSSGTFSGWRDEDVNTSRSRTKTFLEEDDEDDLNEGFCLYSVIDE